MTLSQQQPDGWLKKQNRAERVAIAKAYVFGTVVVLGLLFLAIRVIF